MTHSTPLNRLKIGGTAAVVAALMATASVAQMSGTDVPPDSMTTMEAVEFPTLTDVTTDDAVITGLSDQGYENIVVTRAGEAVVVTAERAGLPTEMVFNSADGTLILVDGIEPAQGDAAEIVPPVETGTAPMDPAGEIR